MGIRDNSVKEAKRVEEDALYSAKGHFAAASFWRNFHWFIGVPTAILSAIAGMSALSRFDNHGVVAGVLAIIVTAIIAVATFLNPSEKANAHLRAGNHYNSLRNRTRIFHEIDCLAEGSDTELAGRLKELAKERDELNEQSPQIPGWAYARAKRGIQEGEADYEVDEKENA